MATVSSVIFAGAQKKDGTWNVKIRVSNNSKQAFIETKHFVGKVEDIRKVATFFGLKYPIDFASKCSFAWF